MLQDREGDEPGQGYSWGRTRLLLRLHKLKAVVAAGLPEGGRDSWHLALQAPFLWEGVAKP